MTAQSEIRIQFGVPVHASFAIHILVFNLFNFYFWHINFYGAGALELPK